MSEHKLAKKEEKLHTTVSGSTDNGACLSLCGDNYVYREDSCSYRWQAKVNARERHKKFFDVPSARLAQAKKGSAVGVNQPRLDYAGSHDVFPKDPADWAVDGPSRSPTDPYRTSRGEPVPNGENFKNARWPFWNNAHHMIPKGLFGKLINQSGKAYQLIRVSLLEAKFNIHYKRNMFILPMEQAVGAELFLPRHLGLIRQSDSFNHPDYNDLVESRLKAIIDDYKKICDDAVANTEAHKVPNAKLDKAKLESLFRRCEAVIKIYGAVAMGGQIDQMKGANTGF